MFLVPKNIEYNSIKNPDSGKKIKELIKKWHPQNYCHRLRKSYFTSISFVENISLEILSVIVVYTAQKMKISIQDIFSKCDQIRSFLRIWSH